jgi:hypothetical protein
MDHADAASTAASSVRVYKAANRTNRPALARAMRPAAIAISRLPRGRWDPDGSDLDEINTALAHTTRPY